ncbi:conserved hypothetical protein [uncultured Paludibacter sp.]|nr:conserved hypothetical protein [uncultured Paludibacter sp.]
MLINERDTRRERIIQVANAMITAARTAPKGKGFDIIEIKLVIDEDIETLSKAMLQYSEKTGLMFVKRDAENILHSGAIILIGTKQKIHHLNCGYCGFDTCEEKMKFPSVPCSLNSVDVGIALGSAVSVAADNRVDTRIMFSAGRVALEKGWMPECSNVYAIPLSCSSKNPFFDRQSTRPK